MKKNTKKHQKNQKKSTKKLALHRETLSVMDEGKLTDVVGGMSRCPTACSVC